MGVSTQQPDYLKFLFEQSEDFSALPTFAVIPAQKSIFNAAASGIPGFEIDPTKASKISKSSPFSILLKILFLFRVHSSGTI